MIGTGPLAASIGTKALGLSRKQALKGLLKVAPEQHYGVDAWPELLDTECSERKSKPVD
jgi:hypothetical protein